MPDDTFFMNKAISLAKKGTGHTSPNPLVGAVIVRDGRIIGKGYHKRFGGDHAEIAAIKNAGGDVRDTDLYVNLEPCCHTNKQTPPCTQEIIKRGIRNVFIAAIDPNPEVAGNGVEELIRAGVNVRTGIMKKEAERLNEFFIKYISTGQPFTILKAAISLDGRIALSDGSSKWITGAEARKRVHSIRHSVDAILVGTKTILSDDPELTTRGLSNGLSPVRVILDSRLCIPADAKVFNSTGRPPIIVTGPLKPLTRNKLLERRCEILELETKCGLIMLADLKKALGKRGITSLLIEGGSGLFTSAIKEKIVDKVIFMIATKLLGSDSLPVIGPLGLKRLPDAVTLENINLVKAGSDIIIEGYPIYE